MLSAAQGFTYNKFEKPNDWPKLKDTFDYQYENGKLAGGNEHLYLSGPVTYNIIGSPTISNGSASGFSGSNYLKTNSPFAVAEGEDFEFFTRCTIPTVIDKEKAYLFSIGYDGKGYGAGLFISSNYEVTFACYALGGVVLSDSVVAGQTYYIKAGRSNGQTYVGVSIDNQNWTIQNGTGAKMNNAWGSADQLSTFIGRSKGYAYYCAFNGSIDLNETYIKVNGSLWFYGKNYTTKNMVPVPAGLEYNNTTTPSIGWVYTSNELVKGPVNYTKVGNPTIVDGIASGFSADNNYLTTSSAIQLSNNYNGLELQTKIKATAFSGTKIALNWATDDGGASAGLGFSGSKLMCLLGRVHGASYQFINSTFNATADTWYWLKLKGANNNVVFSYSTDGVTYIQIGTLENLTGFEFYNTFGIGHSKRSDNSYAHFVDGSIDLNHTYIKVNGQAWFGSVSKFQEFIPAPQGTMIGKDDTHSLNVVSKNNIGTFGYTVVGSPTIVEGVVSDFAASSYIKTESFSSNTAIDKHIEIQFKLKTPSDMTGYQYLISQLVSGGVFGGTNLFLNTGYLGSLASMDGSNWSSATTNYQLSADTTYDLKYNYNKDTYQEKFSIKQGNTWTEVATITRNSAIYGSSLNLCFGSGVTFNNPFRGTIDLNETYIKVNDQVWFGTLPAEPKLVGPVDYTVKGSPTINNSVVSGFSSANYLKLQNQFGLEVGEDFEFFTKFVCPNADDIQNTRAYIWGLDSTGHGYGEGIYINNSLKPMFALYTLGQIILNYTLTVGNPYYLKAGRTNGQTYIGISADNSNWTIANGTSRNMNNAWTAEGATNLPVIGRAQPDSFAVADAFPSSIDLNETYIKVNGSLWFGKENWTPSTYKDNSIYLLGSHKADYSNYNQLSLTPSIETESNEVGSYNVWIDNQKVIENKTGYTLIEWDKLELTTGYSITTPSALKAHPIKIEPTNSTDSIIAFNTETIEESDESI